MAMVYLTSFKETTSSSSMCLPSTVQSRRMPPGLQDSSKKVCEKSKISSLLTSSVGQGHTHTMMGFI